MNRFSTDQTLPNQQPRMRLLACLLVMGISIGAALPLVAAESDKPASSATAAAAAAAPDRLLTDPAPTLKPLERVE